jgi:putative transposase
LKKSRCFLRPGVKRGELVWFIGVGKADYRISLRCQKLGVSRSGFHAWQRRARSDRELADVWLVERLQEIQGESRHTYGAGCVQRPLRHCGVRVGREY